MHKENLVVVFMGSKKDFDSTEGIRSTLENFDVPYEVRALSAHKAPSEVLRAIEEYDSRSENVVYIAVAGKSNALGPVIAGNSPSPVINCPVISSYKEDLFSSLRMPTAVTCSTVLKPKNAALHAIKIFSLTNPDLKEEFQNYRSDIRQKLKRDDEQLKS